MRRKGVKKVAKNNHGLILAEFLWRQSVARSQWCDAPFFALCDLLVEYQQVELQGSMEAVPHPYAVTEEVAQGFQDFRDSHRAIQPPAPPVVAAAALFPHLPTRKRTHP